MPDGDSMRPCSSVTVARLAALRSGRRLRESGCTSSGCVKGSGSDWRQPAGMRWLNAVSVAAVLA